jgi:hypothetical protein
VLAAGSVLASAAPQREQNLLVLGSSNPQDGHFRSTLLVSILVSPYDASAWPQF